MARNQEISMENSGFEDDYRGFDPGEEESARGPLILALAVGVMLVFGAVVWNTYRAGVRTEADGVPSVIAEATPYKHAPAEPGGVEVPDTDKRFYDQIDASERPAVEAISAPVAAPAAEPVLTGGPVELRPAVRPPVAPEAQVLAEEVAPAPVIEPTPVAATPAAPETSSQFAFTGTGQYLVQVAAFRSEDQAEDAWQRVTAADPSLFRGAAKQIQKADLGPKGVFYRLRIGAFADKAEAAAFCTALKETGSNCIVVTG